MGFVHALHAFERSWNGKPHLKVDLFLYKYNNMKINTILFLSMLLGADDGELPFRTEGSGR